MFYFFYYFPLGLDVRPQRRVWATWAIVAACVAVFVLQRTHPMFFWVNHGALVFMPSEPSPSSLILNAYLHGGWLHLISNMISLAVFGPALEGRIGARRFLLLYHLCNVFANVVQGALVLLALPAYAGAGVVGASGAIAGILGLCAVRLDFARLRLGYWAFLPLQAFTRCGLANIPMLAAIVLWFVLQTALALIQLQGAGAGVAVGSHLGGLAAGVALGLLAGERRAARCEALLQRGRRYLDRALWYPAQGEFIEYVRRMPHDPEGHLELARTYRLTGRNGLADDHYRAACNALAAAGDLDRVETVYVEAEKGSPMFALVPARQLQLAQAQERCLRLAAAEQTYIRYAHHHALTHAAPLALYRAARLAAKRPGHACHAQTLYQRLVDDYPLSAEAGLARNELQLLAAA
jgi:membrane associated rhomboid family serine protease